MLLVRSPRRDQRVLFPVVALAFAASVVFSGSLLTEVRAEGSRKKPVPSSHSQPAETAAAKAAAAGSELTPRLDRVALKALAARSIGPAIMGGRVSDIAFDPSDSNTFYVALGTGGVMKTTDLGASFSAIFEKEAVAAAGAVAVAPSDAKVVWIGTGEGNDRNSSSWGNGVYRSTDSGGSWENAGLPDSKSIPRVVVHPNDPQTAWVAVMGDLWNPSPGRGLYTTTDAGKTWKTLLSAPEPYTDRVGCGDIAIDPADPATIYASLYARRRTPWSFVTGPEATDGKDLGGLFKSTDGGATWRKLAGGLPSGTGRIGISIHAKNPKIVYAVVTTDEGGAAGWDVKSKLGGVFRTEDGGDTWKRVSEIDPRPFYFSQVRVDPANDQRVYVLGMMTHVSDNAGATFREDYFTKIHPDCHALAIDPKNPKHLLLGTDGGVYQSFDGGKSTIFLNRFAAGEFYRVNADSGKPYRVCGGLQDNSNWMGPSQTRSKDQIMNSDWTNIGGGDGFYCIFDPDDRDIVYAESQQGEIHRFNGRTGEVKALPPQPGEGHAAFRFHWNSPFIGSVHAKGVMYLAGNRVFKLTERAERWKAISPDLSTQDPAKILSAGSGAETYGVVYSLAESPLSPGLLWAATDDGKLWMTADEGGTWSDLTANLPPAIKGQWISRVEAGHFDAKAAYLAVDAHRSGNYHPLAYKTVDGGKSWVSISSDLPGDGPVKVIREDFVNRNLLYAGTEFGLFASLDGGGHWVTFGELPTVAVDDIVIQREERDLVVATHGRSLFIVDDTTPLQEMTAEVFGKNAHLFTPLPATGAVPLEGWADVSGTAGIYRGTNPPEGMLFSVWVRQFTADPLKLAVTDAAGGVVANLTLPGTPGINRINWDLKWTHDLLTDYGGQGAKFVKPGEYTIKLSYGKIEETRKVRIDIASGLETN